MKSFLLILFTVFIFSQTEFQYPIPFTKPVNNFFYNVKSDRTNSDYKTGIRCITCTILVRYVDDIANYRNESIAEALKFICEFLPEKEKKLCDDFVLLFGPIIIELLELAVPPDIICQKITFCKDPRCHLFTEKIPKNIQIYTPPKELVKSIKMRRRIEDPLPPVIDHDKDNFSPSFYSVRGSAWKGKDCNDEDATIYPGRRIHEKKDVDYNCNGIYGKDPQSGEYYVDKFCNYDENNVPRGIAVVGDSLSAHFRIPPVFLSPAATEEQMKYIVDVGDNELDWPFLSTMTGYMDDYTGLTPGNHSSVYKKMNERNLCTHRNVGVNGARAPVLPTQIKQLNRNKNDYPLTLFIEVIGDDVCDHGVWEFTPIEKFHKGMADTLDYLDTVLPSNSLVIVIGLIDGW